MTFRNRLLATAVAITLSAAPLAATAQQGGGQQGGGQPVLLSADQFRHDRDLGIVTASGNVEMAQGGRILLADSVSFSERTNVVTASGNVSVLEPSGEVLFAEYVELTDDMRQGFIQEVRMLMTDNSRLAGAQGERLDGRYTRVERGVYSPCELCKEDPTRPPIWQIRAARVTHDQEKRDVHYRDAVLEIAGIPVAYTPYFAHPDPTVERRSGFLTPGGGFSGDLGTFARAYYFFDITPSQDFTLEVTPSEEDGLLLGGEYRKRFDRGSLVLSGSATYAERTEGFGPQQTASDEFRGHLFGTGRFEIDNAWRWGFDVQRVTDTSHLRRYDYSDEDLLTSRAYIERFVARDYLALNAYAFQDLRPGNQEEEPTVVPLLTWAALGEPGGLLGGRWSVDAGALSLVRTDGTDTRRVSAEAGWQRRLVAPVGIVATLQASLRGDAYWVTDFQSRPGGPVEDDVGTFRAFPQAQFTMSWPFARQSGTVQQLIEPILSVTAAPNSDNDDDIPNEDSLDVEFDHTSLFLPSRFPGVDRLEGGQRVTYGLRAGLFGFGGGGSSFFFGQSYRLQRDPDFPVGSGLEDRLSDFVGRIEVTPSPWLDLSYSFRLDSETLAQRRHDVFGVAGPAEFRVSGSYLYLDRQVLEGGRATRNREELTLAVNSAFAENWSVGVSHRRDLAADGGPISAGLLLTYQDECFTFQLVGERDYTRRSGLESGDRVFFRLTFKNLGEFASPSIAGGS